MWYWRDRLKTGKFPDIAFRAFPFMTHYTMEWRLLASYIDKGWRVGVSRFEKKSHQLNQLSRSVTNNNVLVYGFKKKIFNNSQRKTYRLLIHSLMPDWRFEPLHSVLPIDHCFLHSHQATQITQELFFFSEREKRMC